MKPISIRIVVLCLFGFLSSGSLVIAQQPASDPGKSSSFSGGPVTVTFANKGSSPVELFWVDFSGIETSYALIQPDESLEQGTGPGHLWRLKRNGKIVAFYQANEEVRQTIAVGEPEMAGPGHVNDLTGQWKDTGDQLIEIRQTGNQIVVEAKSAELRRWWDSGQGTATENRIVMEHKKDGVATSTEQGTVSDNHSRIDWDNGTHWVREAKAVQPEMDAITSNDSETLKAAEELIDKLADAKIQAVDAPHTAGREDYFVSVQNHVNGMARIGDYWITNYPDVDRKTGRLCIWNENAFSYLDPHSFNTDGGFPAGMDAAENYLAVACNDNKIRFFSFNRDSTALTPNTTKADLKELPAFTSDGQNINIDAVGLAYNPDRDSFYMITKRRTENSHVDESAVYKGTPGGMWTFLGTIPGRSPSNSEESQPMVHLGNNLFAVFKLVPTYEFSYWLIEIDANDQVSVKRKETEETTKIKDEGEAMGAPSFRWAGCVTFDGRVLRLYAAPKRLDSSGNFYYWYSDVDSTKADYKIKCHTADAVDAGTDSSIYLTINGTDGSTEEQRVNGLVSGNAFESDNTDEFTLKDQRDVGAIVSLTLRSDGYDTAADWLPDWIEITAPNGETTRLAANEWLKEFELKKTFSDRSRTYPVKIKTGVESSAGTDSNVFLTIYGANGSTPEIRLNGYLSGNAFENGDEDQLELNLKDVGEIQSVTLRSDNSYPGSDWYLEWIEVSGKRFKCREWLTENAPMKTLTTLTKTYNIVVKTGTKSGAGTDSNIYLTIDGGLGTTGETRLNGYISGDAFENGDKDTVSLDLNDVGDTASVTVRSDGWYAGSDWYLEYIEINGKRFNANRWIEDDDLKATLK